jgi:hypothetical protein
VTGRRTWLDSPKRERKQCAYAGCVRLALGRKGAKYCSDRCRQKAYRERLEVAARAAGLPPRLTVAGIENVPKQPETSRDASSAPGAPQTRRKRASRNPFQRCRCWVCRELERRRAA